MEDWNQKPEKRNIEAWLSFGMPGHESEYTFTPTSSNDFLPGEIGKTLESILGEDWYVCDRGNRIEIRNNKNYGTRDDEKIKSAIEKANADIYKLRTLL